MTSVFTVKSILWSLGFEIIISYRVKEEQKEKIQQVKEAELCNTAFKSATSNVCLPEQSLQTVSLFFLSVFQQAFVAFDHLYEFGCQKMLGSLHIFANIRGIVRIYIAYTRCFHVVFCTASLFPGTFQSLS